MAAIDIISDDNASPAGVSDDRFAPGICIGIWFAASGLLWAAIVGLFTP